MQLYFLIVLVCSIAFKAPDRYMEDEQGLPVELPAANHSSFIVILGVFALVE